MRLDPEIEKDIDIECLELVRAINNIPGITTTESCCGHDKSPFWIFFRPNNLECLPNLLYWFDVCHCNCESWSVRVYTDCSKDHASFVVEGPIGDKAYKDAVIIAKLIEDDNLSKNIYHYVEFHADGGQVCVPGLKRFSEEDKTNKFAELCKNEVGHTCKNSVKQFSSEKYLEQENI